MRVNFEALVDLRGRVAMVDGAFDPLHHGHVAYFERAAALGLPLLCNVASDAYLAGKHRPLLRQEHRAQVIDALRPIAWTHANPFDTETVLRELRPALYVKGADWKGRLPEEQVRICAEHGIEIVYLDTVLDSSSRLLAAHAASSGSGEQVAAFEELVQGQAANGAARFDADYFTAAWRAENNRYTVEARRPIEGEGPRRLLETFRPERVLDMGCGPGALMYLLWELGVAADGVDFSPECRDLAPPEVRGRMRIGAVTDVALPAASYDLVVCREVLEHLTVLEVQKAVENLCRISSRFVYVTTRFHPAPPHLFDVTDELHADPTHITVMSKDLLRLMFVLQGYRRRADLEERMDWLGKGRVLVYERGAAATVAPRDAHEPARREGEIPNVPVRRAVAR
jgi:cytidyltransferase-like protein